MTYSNRPSPELHIYTIPLAKKLVDVQIQLHKARHLIRTYLGYPL